MLALVPLLALYRRYVSPAAALLSLLLLSTSVVSRPRAAAGERTRCTPYRLGVLPPRWRSEQVWRYWAWAGVAASLGLYSTSQAGRS
ncbi:MAG: hypothetical protein WKH64_12845 [Chloroflexia bacterium]